MFMTRFEAIQSPRKKGSASAFSFVIGLVDAYTGGPLIQSGTLILLEGVRKKPVKKADGYFVFTDLLPEQYRVHIHSEHYFEENLDIRFDPDQRVTHLQLAPKPSYPFRPGATIARASLRGRDGRPLNGVEISARVLSEDCGRTRIAQDTAAKGTLDILTANIVGKIAEGDKYWIKERTNDQAASDSVEICQIAGSYEWIRKLSLAEPLRSDYHRGALLLPVTRTRSDEKGEAVIPFRASPAKSFRVEIEFRHSDRQHVQEVELQANEITNLGVISL